ncbi:DUF4126 domain-containing protein [Chitinophaga qingshengii]|uniref:DUF4126 domain-containing protein n=1 Tax=Chitinophaga qingshengii TaxID=1569794 RepID=A0ABR7TXY1_9BACT|nr:DUF4126 domain-containing protein [Chitinophaga qingshengii]MBC9934543.1 DUF4126 domain-containing protein [Chitinophaga qingshengii]
MKKSIFSTLMRAVGLGIVSGMRSSMGPAFASQYANRYPSRQLKGTPLAFMQREGVMRSLQTMAAGEMVVDKVHGIPDRIVPGSLAGRAAAGGLAGATLYQSAGDKAWRGALVGAVAAVAASYVFFYLRRHAGKKFRMKDGFTGGVEDILAVGIGAGATAGK